MELPFNDSLLDLDYDYSGISPNPNDFNKPADKKNSTLEVKRRIIATSKIIKSFKHTKLQLEEKEREINTLRSDYETVCSDYRAVLETHIPLEETIKKKDTQIQHLQKIEIDYEALQSHTNQLEVLVKDLESKVQGLTIEKKLMKIDEETQKKIQALEKENRKHIKRIETLEKIELEYYMKDSRLTPQKYSKILEVAPECDSEKDADKRALETNSCYSADTGQGSSLAFSDDEKTITSPDYLGNDDSPLSLDAIFVETELKQCADANTSPFKMSRDIGTDSRIDENVGIFLDASTSPIKALNDQNISSSPVKKINEPYISNNIQCGNSAKQIDGLGSQILSKEYVCDASDNEISNILKKMSLSYRLTTPLPESPVRKKKSSKKGYIHQMSLKPKMVMTSKRMRKLELFCSQQVKINKKINMNFNDMHKGFDHLNSNVSTFTNHFLEFFDFYKKMSSNSSNLLGHNNHQRGDSLRGHQNNDISSSIIHNEEDANPINIPSKLDEIFEDSAFESGINLLQHDYQNDTSIGDKDSEALNECISRDSEEPQLVVTESKCNNFRKSKVTKLDKLRRSMVCKGKIKNMPVPPKKLNSIHSHFKNSSSNQETEKEPSLIINNKKAFEQAVKIIAEEKRKKNDKSSNTMFKSKPDLCCRKISTDDNNVKSQSELNLESSFQPNASPILRKSPRTKSNNSSSPKLYSDCETKSPKVITQSITSSNEIACTRLKRKLNSDACLPKNKRAAGLCKRSRLIKAKKISNIYDETVSSTATKYCNSGRPSLEELCLNSTSPCENVSLEGSPTFSSTASNKSLVDTARRKLSYDDPSPRVINVLTTIESPIKDSKNKFKNIDCSDPLLHAVHSLCEDDLVPTIGLKHNMKENNSLNDRNTLVKTSFEPSIPPIISYKDLELFGENSDSSKELHQQNDLVHVQDNIDCKLKKRRLRKSFSDKKMMHAVIPLAGNMPSQKKALKYSKEEKDRSCKHEIIVEKLLDVSHPIISYADLDLFGGDPYDDLNYNTSDQNFKTSNKISAPSINACDNFDLFGEDSDSSKESCQQKDSVHVQIDNFNPKHQKRRMTRSLSDKKSKHSIISLSGGNSPAQKKNLENYKKGGLCDQNTVFKKLPVSEGNSPVPNKNLENFKKVSPCEQNTNFKKLPVVILSPMSFCADSDLCGGKPNKVKNPSKEKGTASIVYDNLNHMPYKRVTRSSSTEETKLATPAIEGSKLVSKFNNNKKNGLSDQNTIVKDISSITKPLVISYNDLDLSTDAIIVKKSNQNKSNGQSLRKIVEENDSTGSVLNADGFFCTMLQKYVKPRQHKVPKLIPEKVTTGIVKKLEENINIIIELPSNESTDAMIDLAKALQPLGPKQFTAGLVKFLMSENRKKDVICRTYTPPAPPMTKPEQVLLYILKCLRVHWMDSTDVVDTVLRSIEYSLFRLNHTPDFEKVDSLSHFYAVLCRYTRDKNRLRVFMLDAMYCMSYKAIPVIRQCLDAWMHVLPLAHLHLANNSIVFTLVYLLHYFKCNDCYHIVQDLRNILSRKYFYKMSDWCETSVLNKFKSSILDIKEFKIEKKMLTISLVLLAKRNGASWCQKHIVDGILLPLIKRKDLSENVKKYCVSLLGPLMRPFPDHMKLQCEIVINHLFVMIDENPSPSMLEAILTSLILLRKHCLKRIIKLLLSWDPKTPVSPELELTIKTLIQEKPLPLWVNTLSSVI